MIRGRLNYLLVFVLLGAGLGGPVSAKVATKISQEQKKTFSIGMKAMRASHYPRASQAFESLLAQKPDWGLVHLQLGQLALNTDSNTRRAITHLSKATALIPKNPRAQHQLGLAYQLGGHCSKALNAFNTAIELRASYLDAHLSKAQCQEQTGQISQAIATLESILAMKSKHVGALGNIARLYEEKGMHSKAETTLVQLTKLEPKAFAYHLTLAYFYQRQGQVKKARFAFDKADELKPRPRRKMRPLPKSRDAP